MSKEVKAIVVATGNEVMVYKHRSEGTWIDSEDCETEYLPKELIIELT